MEMTSIKTHSLSQMISLDETGVFLSELLMLNLRAFVLLLVCLFVLRFLRLSASTKHVILMAAFMATILLPIYSKLFPPVIIEVPQDEQVSVVDKSIVKIYDWSNQFSNTNEISFNGASFVALEGSDNFISSNSKIENSQQSTSLSTYVILTAVVIYGLGVFICLFKIFLSNLHVLITICRSSGCHNLAWQKIVDEHSLNFWIRKPVYVRVSRSVVSPVTWGFWRPTILIPQDAEYWSDELIKSTVLHELAHVKRSDWLVKQIARCVCAIYWANPFVWKYFNKMMLNVESAADDMALSSGLKKTVYAEDLVAVVEKVRQPMALRLSAMAMSSMARSELVQRIEFILNPQNKHHQTSYTGFAFSVLLVLGIVLPVVSLQIDFSKPVLNQVVTAAYALKGDSSKKDSQVEKTVVSDEQKNDQSLDEKLFYTNQQTILIVQNYLDQVKLSADQFNRAKLELDVQGDLKNINTASHSKQFIVISSGSVGKNYLAQRNGSNEAQSNKQQTENESAKELAKSSSNKNALVAFLTTEFESGIEASQNLKPRRLAKPKYPESARRRGIEGEVKVRYQVDLSGRVVNPTILNASPEGVFDKSVIRALSRTSYQVPEVLEAGDLEGTGENVKTLGEIQEVYRFILDA